MSRTVDLKVLEELKYRFATDPAFLLEDWQVRGLLYLSEKALETWKVFSGLDTMDAEEVKRHVG